MNYKKAAYLLRAAADEFVDFTADLDAAKSGADDDETKIVATALGIGGGFGFFRLTDDVLAEVS